MSKLTIGIVLGSTRPGRKGGGVAEWVLAQAASRTEASYELIDLADFALPHLDEIMPASMGQYANDHTKAWAEKIDGFDGFVFVTPEYNHSTSGALKNALDFLYQEWNDKAAGFVSYGGGGGARAVEHLRLIVGELQMADVRAQVAFSLHTDFENYETLKPSAQHVAGISTLFDQLESWSGALRTVREAKVAIAA